MAKKPSNLLKKPKSTDKGYTKSQMLAHLVEAVNNRGVGEVNKKQAQACVEELVNLMLNYAPVGANLPGLGKLVLKKTPRRPARMGRNPATGEEIKIAAKPAGKKLVFRVNKAAKLATGVVKE
ncbi:MAG: HU family DNA-binding protein [Planctomycetota bacterium]